MIHIPPAPSQPPALSPDADQAIQESAQRFEVTLRKELGMVANFADVPSYIEKYKAELRTFYADLAKRGMLK